MAKVRIVDWILAQPHTFCFPSKRCVFTLSYNWLHHKGVFMLYQNMKGVKTSGHILCQSHIFIHCSLQIY